MNMIILRAINIVSNGYLILSLNTVGVYRCLGHAILLSDGSAPATSITWPVMCAGNNTLRFFVGSYTTSGNVYAIREVYLYGNFNMDELSLSLTNNLDSRLEIRNENGVLIWDNGKPLPGDTYPPDAKNRSGLTGLHAGPAVINPELEVALTGDVTNKEAELTGSERGAGVQYALEKDEDNGL